MKKEIKTYEELAKCHLKYFTAIFKGEVIDGTVLVYDDSINLHYNQNFGDGIQYLISIHGTDILENSPLSNLIVEVDEWQPKFGEVVIAYDDEEDEIKKKHIFLFKKDNLYHCVRASYQSVDYYHRNDIHFSYDVSIFNFVKQIEEPKTIEISIEEAKEIIAKEKGIKAEQVNLNFKIN